MTRSIRKAATAAAPLALGAYEGQLDLAAGDVHAGVRRAVQFLLAVHDRALPLLVCSVACAEWLRQRRLCTADAAMAALVGRAGSERAGSECAANPNLAVCTVSPSQYAADPNILRAFQSKPVASAAMASALLMLLQMSAALEWLR